MSSFRDGGILFVERGKGGFLEEIGKEREKEKKKMSINESKRLERKEEDSGKLEFKLVLF